MKIKNKLTEDKFKNRFGQRFTSELEIYLANSNLSQHDKMVLIDFIEGAFELGSAETKMPRKHFEYGSHGSFPGKYNSEELTRKQI